MASLKQRQRAEYRLSKALSNLMSKQKKKLISLLKSEGTIPEGFWSDQTNLMTEELTEHFKRTWLIGYEHVEKKALPVEAAWQWAKDYTYKLIKGINKTTRGYVLDGMKEFLVEGGTIRDFISKIEATAFAPWRLQMIAVTETTRAFAESASHVKQEYEELGYETVEIWITRGGSCDICKENEGKERSQWTTEIPAHVGCDCGVAVRVKDGI